MTTLDLREDRDQEVLVLAATGGAAAVESLRQVAPEGVTFGEIDRAVSAVRVSAGSVLVLDTRPGPGEPGDLELLDAEAVLASYPSVVSLPSTAEVVGIRLIESESPLEAADGLADMVCVALATIDEMRAR